MENWRDIEGFEGYQVSVLIYVFVFKKRRSKGLPTEAIPGTQNPQNLLEVNHKDEDKSSNIVENLEWCDRSYNINYGTRTQKCADKESKMVDQIDPITGEVIRKWASVNECGRNGYASSAVSRCCNGLRKTHKGYIWKYVPM